MLPWAGLLHAEWLPLPAGSPNLTSLATAVGAPRMAGTLLPFPTLLDSLQWTGLCRPGSLLGLPLPGTPLTGRDGGDVECQGNLSEDVGSPPLLHHGLLLHHLILQREP